MNTYLYSIGYMTTTPDELARIADAHKAMVVDIRYSRLSRVPRWTGEALQTQLGPHRYRAIAELGNRNYKGGPIAIANLEKGLNQLDLLMELDGPLILLCACADFQGCHRETVALAARKELNTTCVHLYGTRTTKAKANAHFRLDAHPTIRNASHYMPVWDCICMKGGSPPKA